MDRGALACNNRSIDNNKNDVTGRQSIPEGAEPFVMPAQPTGHSFF